METAKKAYDCWNAQLPVDVAAGTPADVAETAHGRNRRPRRKMGSRNRLWPWRIRVLVLPPAQAAAADYSPTAVSKARDYARQRELSGITWKVADIQAIAHPDASFDIVISSETIEHILSPQKALRELARVLRPGGRLFLRIPNYLGIIWL